MILKLLAAGLAVIFALSLLAFYLVLMFILQSKNKDTNPFNSYFISAAEMINDYFYKKIYSFYEYFFATKKLIIYNK